MRLVSLSLQNYRKFSDVQVEFPDGVTGIIGLNGVGKSSLVEAIAWVLYGHDATRTKKEGIKRSQASRDTDCIASLKLEISGDSYEISRALRGVNLSTDARIAVNGKEWARSADKTTREVVKLLGMDRRSFFRSFYAKQKELNILSGITPRDRKDVIIKMLRIDALDRAVEKMKSDRKEKTLVLDTLRSQIPDKKGIEADIAETEERVKELTRMKEAQTAVLKKLDSSVQLAKGKLREFDELRDKVEEARGRSIKLETEVRSADATILELKTALDSLVKDEEEFSRLRPAVEDLGELRLEEHRLSQVSKKFVQRQSLVGQVERDSSKKKEIETRLSEVGLGARELDETVLRLKETEQLLKKVRSGVQTLTEKRSSYRGEVEILSKKAAELKSKKTGITELGKDARCPTCGRELGSDYTVIIEHFEKETEVIDEEVLKREKEIEKLEERLLKGQQMISDTEEALKVLREKRISDEKRKEEITQLTIQKDDLERNLRETERQLEELGDVEYDEAGHRELKKSIEEKLQVQDKLTAYRTRLDSRPQIQDRRVKLEASREKLSLDLQKVQTTLKSFDYSREAHLTSKAECELMGEELSQERSKLHSVEMELKSAGDRLDWLKKDVDDAVKKEEEVGRAGDEVEKLTRLIGLFGDFRLQLIQKVRPRLGVLASSFFEQMTEGKYQGMELSEDYELSLIEEGNPYTIDRFSGGETDLANLSLRLAISELILESTGNELSFIILDEIFGSQDAIRKGLIMEALKEISRRFRQILLITHVEEIKDSLENVIEVYEDENGVSGIRQG